MKTTTDIHQNGVFAVKAPDGNVLFDTFASTAYSARANFSRTYNKKWYAAAKLGYTMFGYAEAVQVLTEQREGDTSVSADDTAASEARIAELEAIEQPLAVIEAGNGGDFGMDEYNELRRMRAARDASDTFDLDIPRWADEWDLYSDKAGAEEAAQALGDKLEELVLAARRVNNCTLDEAVRIRDLMYIEMDKYEGIGARDTEPETILVQRIEAALELSESLSR
jgi:hypothetical protein